MAEEYDDVLLESIPPILRGYAADKPISELANIVAQMRVNGTGERSAVNSTMMVEYAAEHRSPAEIAELVGQFYQQRATGDFAQLVLDAAAARQNMTELAKLARELIARDLAEQADMLISSVVRRRLPRDIANMLVILDNSDLTAQLIEMLGSEYDDGLVFVVLWLRVLSPTQLAEHVSAKVAENLGPDGLAEFIRGLRASHDAASADAAVRSALGQNLGVVEAVIEHLRSATGTQDGDADTDARYLLGQALEMMDAKELEISDLVVLASLLSGGSWKEGADIIWAAILPGLEEGELVAKLEAGIARGNAAGMLDALRKAAEVHDVERIARLAVEVDHKMKVDIDGEAKNGLDTLLDTVASSRSIDDVFRMADELDYRGRSDVTTKLLDRLERTVHLREDGADAAEFIDRALIRNDESRGRGIRRAPDGQLQAVVTRVVKNKNPEQLMGMIAGLTRRKKYERFHRLVEGEVAEHYDTALLIKLSLIRKLEYLPAKLEILLTTLKTPKNAQPNAIAGIIQALKGAGVPGEDLARLLTYIGAQRRYLDYDAIITALMLKELREEAQWVKDGRDNKHLRTQPFYPSPAPRGHGGQP